MLLFFRKFTTARVVHGTEYLRMASVRIEKTDGVSINSRGTRGVRTIILIGIAFYIMRAYVFRHVRIT